MSDNTPLMLAVVIPAYNEAACIEQVIREWDTYLASRPVLTGEPLLTYKIIVVNDGSKDDTGPILDRLSHTLPVIPLHQPNSGHGNALLNGYAHALRYRPQYIFQTDSDDQFKPQDFGKLWARRHQSQLVLGYRKVRYDAPIRLVITRVVRVVIAMLYGTYLRDSNIPYRLYDAAFLAGALKVIGRSRPFAPNIFLSVMARKSGQDLAEIPVTHLARKTGTVSILNLKLLRVCLRSAAELWQFRRYFRQYVYSAGISALTGRPLQPGHFISLQ